MGYNNKHSLRNRRTKLAEERRDLKRRTYKLLRFVNNSTNAKFINLTKLQKKLLKKQLRLQMRLIDTLTQRLENWNWMY